MAGALAVGAAGCTQRDSSGRQPGAGAGPVRFGYGGAPVVASSAAAAVAASAPAAESEPNDTRSNATSITRGTEVSGTLSDAEVDWYAFEASDGETVTVTYDANADSGVSGVALYDSDGNFLDQVYASAPSTVELSASTAEGTNYVQVLNVENGAGDYTVTVDPPLSEGSGGPTPTATDTATPTATDTATPTATNTATPTATDTATPTATSTSTETTTPISTGTATPTPTRTQTTTAPPTRTIEDDYGTQNYGEYGYGGVTDAG